MTSIVVPPLDGGHKYHVFIAHAPDDDELSIELSNYLETIGLKCLLAERDFLPGSWICDNSLNGINTSRRVLLVLSRAFLVSGWCTFEVIIAMEKMNSDNNVIIVPLLVDLADKDVPQMLRPVTYVTTKEANYKDRLAHFLAGADVRVDDLLPAGNVAHGLAWNYYYGYLSIVLPGIDTNITNSSWWKMTSKNGHHVIARKMYILIPRSCQCPESLTNVDKRIEHVGSLKDISKSRAGNMNRVYRTSVWRIQRDSDQEVYFAGEFSTVLDTMHMMEQGQVAGLNSDNRRHEVQRFCTTLGNILEHRRSIMCHGRFSLVVYDDTLDANSRESLSSILTDRILSDIQAEAAQDAVLNGAQVHMDTFL